MSTSFSVFPILILMFLLVMLVPAMIGIFVYRDARSRGMDALLWTLVAVFAPGFIGLIVYLIVRKDHIKLSCPSCGNEVQQSFVSCPNCGQKLCASCVNCGAGLQPEWKLCPQCGTEITQADDFASPVASKSGNKVFIAAIIAILAVPLILVILAFSGLMFYRSSPSVSDETEFFYDLTFEDDMQPVCVTSSDACELTDEQREWIKEKQSGEKATNCERCPPDREDRVCQGLR